LRLGSVTAQHSGSGCQPNFAALNRGRQLYSAGRPSPWALAHILVTPILFPTKSPAAVAERLWLWTHLGHQGSSKPRQTTAFQYNSSNALKNPTSKAGTSQKLQENFWNFLSSCTSQAGVIPLSHISFKNKHISVKPVTTFSTRLCA